MTRELTGRAREYDEWYYWMSIMGAPSASEPWGWQIDGHHLIANCFVLGDQIVHPGDKFEVAVFAINGPISAAPANFLWFREAKVEFYR